MTDLNTTPPSWATETDIAHPAWKPFLAYMRDLVEYPTAKLWTIWHAAWMQSGTEEMRKQFDYAQSLRDRIEVLTKKSVVSNG